MRRVTVEGEVARGYLAKLRPFRKKTVTMCVELSEPVHIETTPQPGGVAGTLDAEIGDYLCRAVTGGWYAIPAESFATLYEEDV